MLVSTKDDKKVPPWKKNGEYQYPEGSSARFYIDPALIAMIVGIVYQYPEGSGACFHAVQQTAVLLGRIVSIPRRVGGVFPLPAIDYFTSHSVFTAKYRFFVATLPAAGRRFERGWWRVKRSFLQRKEVEEYIRDSVYQYPEGSSARFYGEYVFYKSF